MSEHIFDEFKILELCVIKELKMRTVSGPLQNVRNL